MKKVLKVLFINLIILFSIFIIVEIICFIGAVVCESQYIGYKRAIVHCYQRYFVTPTYQYYDVPSKTERPVAGKGYKKKPILLFGCSVTYGNLLSDNENFSGQLSKLTKRPVYNLANDGWSFAHMLKHLQSNEAINNIDPEYIIYTYINDQRRRMYFIQGWNHDTELYLRYIPDRNGNLKEAPKKYHFWYRFFIVKYIQERLQWHYRYNEQKTSDLMFKIFEESTKIIKAKYPNAKLVLLLYEDNDCNDREQAIHENNHFLTPEEENKFRELGFSIYNIEKMAGRVYCKSDYKVDNHHPNSKMWSEFLPILIKELNIK